MRSLRILSLSVTFLSILSSQALAKDHAVKCELSYSAHGPSTDPDLSFSYVGGILEGSQQTSNIYNNSLVTLENQTQPLRYEVNIRERTALSVTIRNLSTYESASFFGNTDLISNPKLGANFRIRLDTKVAIPNGLTSDYVQLDCRSVQALPPEPVEDH